MSKPLSFEEYAAENFKVDNDGHVRWIRRKCFNGNGLLAPVGYTELEAVYAAKDTYIQHLEAVVSRAYRLESIILKLEYELEAVKKSINALKKEDNNNDNFGGYYG